MFGKKKKKTTTIRINAVKHLDAMSYKLKNRRITVVKHHTFEESLIVVIINKKLLTFESEEELREFSRNHNTMQSTIVTRGLQCVYTFEYPLSLEMYACIVNAFDHLGDLEPLNVPEIID